MSVNDIFANILLVSVSHTAEPKVRVEGNHKVTWLQESGSSEDLVPVM